MMPGTRDNAGKVRFGLIPWDALALAARILERVGKERDWEGGFSWVETSESLLRHLFAWLSGEDTDRDSGFDHTGHVLCNALFLAAHTVRGIGTDDRPKYDAGTRARILAGLLARPEPVSPEKGMRAGSAPGQRDCRECANPCKATTSPGCAEVCEDFVPRGPEPAEPPEPERCTCDDNCDSPCPAHKRENDLQNRALAAETELARVREAFTERVAAWRNLNLSPSVFTEDYRNGHHDACKIHANMVDRILQPPERKDGGE
jgi:hypothetical protein